MYGLNPAEWTRIKSPVSGVQRIKPTDVVFQATSVLILAECAHGYKKRAVHTQKSIEDIIADAEWANTLQSAIAELSETQRRRFVLYYYSELAYKQIAEMEGCSHVAVMHSLEKAKTAIEKRIKSLK